MAQIVFNRPDEEAMNRVLKKTQCERSGIILRLAWKLGLSREEIRNLSWADFSFPTKSLHLPDRTIPMDDESCIVLLVCMELYYPESRWVVAATRRNIGAQMEPESISRCVKMALNEAGIEGISLADLRNDFVIRALEQHDWSYVSSISGMAVNTLFSKFREYLPSKQIEKCPTQADEPVIDETKIWKLMAKEGASPVGLALHFCWQMGIDAKAAVELTWDQIDFDTKTVNTANQSRRMSNTLYLLLRHIKSGRGPDAEPYVILSERTKTKMDLPRLSKVVRTALIRAGMPNATMRDLKSAGMHGEQERAILEKANTPKGITRKDAVTLFNLSPTKAYNELHHLVESGQLVVAGRRYYLAGSVIPEEAQYQTICNYIKEVGSAYRIDLMELLRVNDKEIRTLLRHLTAEGKLKKDGQVYVLPEDETT